MGGRVVEVEPLLVGIVRRVSARMNRSPADPRRPQSSGREEGADLGFVLGDVRPTIAVAKPCRVERQATERRQLACRDAIDRRTHRTCWQVRSAGPQPISEVEDERAQVGGVLREVVVVEVALCQSTAPASWVPKTATDRRSVSIGDTLVKYRDAMQACFNDVVQADLVVAFDAPSDGSVENVSVKLSNDLEHASEATQTCERKILESIHFGPSEGDPIHSTLQFTSNHPRPPAQPTG